MEVWLVRAIQRDRMIIAERHVMVLMDLIYLCHFVFHYYQMLFWEPYYYHSSNLCSNLPFESTECWMTVHTDCSEWTETAPNGVWKKTCDTEIQCLSHVVLTWKWMRELSGHQDWHYTVCRYMFLRISRCQFVVSKCVHTDKRFLFTTHNRFLYQVGVSVSPFQRRWSCHVIHPLTGLVASSHQLTYIFKVTLIVPVSWCCLIYSGIYFAFT